MSYSQISYPGPDKVKCTQRMKLFEMLMTLGEATCDELERCTGMPHQTVSARINELVNKKRLVWTGQKRLTRYKCPARVYKINELPL